MDRRAFLSYNAAVAAIPLTGAALAGLTEAASAAVRPAPVDFTSNVPALGSFPKRWICGSSSCMDNTDPPVQVHWYNPHTAILRQNKGYSYEAPFAPLYFGNDRVLLLDEGFVQLRNDGTCAAPWTSASPNGARATAAIPPAWNCWSRQPPPCRPLRSDQPVWDARIPATWGLRMMRWSASGA